jgi:SAM-dependent methyltransferase
VVASFPPDVDGTIFDIGGGNGLVSLRLAKAGFDVALVEPGSIGATNAKNRGLETVICATTRTARFKERSLPAVGLFDVIEHIEDDLGFLQSIRGLMQEGGRLYATVPSYSFLWSADDALAGHFRRYAAGDLCRLLQAAGFGVEFSSYVFRFLPVPIFLLRTLPHRLGVARTDREGRKPARDHAAHGGLVADILSSLLWPEIENLDKKKAMRFGASCLVVGRAHL